MLHDIWRRDLANNVWKDSCAFWGLRMVVELQVSNETTWGVMQLCLFSKALSSKLIFILPHILLAGSFYLEKISAIYFITGKGIAPFVFIRAMSWKQVLLQLLHCWPVYFPLRVCDIILESDVVNFSWGYTSVWNIFFIVFVEYLICPFRARNMQTNKQKPIFSPR